MADANLPGAQGNEGGQDPSVNEDQKLANLVNAAVASQLGRHLKKLPELIEAQFAPLREQFAPKAPEPQKTGSTNEPSEVEKRIQSLESALRKEQEGRRMERRQAHEERGFNVLKSALGGRVRPEALETAAKLIKADGRLKIDDKGEVSFLHDGEEHDLGTGVEAWLKTSEGSMFAPPPAKKPAMQAPQRAATPARTQPVTPNGDRTQREDPLQKTLRDLGF